MWDKQAERAGVPLTDEATARLVDALAGGRSVEVGGKVLMKLQADDFFKTNANTAGEYVHAVFADGEVAAAAQSRTLCALFDAVQWAAHVAQGGQPGGSYRTMEA